MEQIDRFVMEKGHDGAVLIRDRKRNKPIVFVQGKYKHHNKNLAEELLPVISKYYETWDGIDGERL